jgi:hypothetical protein
VSLSSITNLSRQIVLTNRLTHPALHNLCSQCLIIMRTTWQSKLGALGVSWLLGWGNISQIRDSILMYITLVFFGGLAVLSGLCAFQLPEIFGHCLPHSFDDVEKMKEETKHI